MTPFLMGAGAKRSRHKLWLVILLLVAGAAAMPVVQWVVLKMLPFDNKSEFQLVLDMPEGATLEQTERTLLAVGRELARVPEVKDYQILRRHRRPHQLQRAGAPLLHPQRRQRGDIQVNLVDKHERDRSSHEIARSVRAPLQAIASAAGGNLKVVEVPRDRLSGHPSSRKCMARRRPPVKPLPAPYRPALWPRRIWWTWTSI